MRIILLACFSFVGLFCSATSIPSLVMADTIGQGKSSKLTKAEFLQQHGLDDSSKALIKYFFYERGYGRSMTLTGGVLTALFSVGAAVAANNADLNPDPVVKTDPTLLYLAFFGILAACGSLAFVLVGIPQMGRYSRNRLLKLLNNYFAGHSFPNSVRNKRVFRGFVQYGEWNYDIKQKLKLKDRENARARHQRMIEKRQLERTAL